MDKPVLTITETSALTGLPPYTIRRWLKEGRIKSIRSGRKYFVSARSLQNLLFGEEKH